MELIRQPETELEYWATIESLGEMIWGIEHNAPHGCLETEKYLCDAREIMETLVSGLFVLFGVIHPKDCPQQTTEGKTPEAPMGMTWYWDWYYKMKGEYYKVEYEKIICSACPLCGGVDDFIENNVIPCTVWPGTLYRLHKPYQCAMTRGPNRSWKEEHLVAEIKKMGGAEAVDNFKAKETEIKER